VTYHKINYYYYSAIKRNQLLIHAARVDPSGISEMIPNTVCYMKSMFAVIKTSNEIPLSMRTLYHTLLSEVI
jgi:hypothetical protein